MTNTRNRGVPLWAEEGEGQESSYCLYFAVCPGGPTTGHRAKVVHTHALCAGKHVYNTHIHTPHTHIHTRIHTYTHTHISGSVSQSLGGKGCSSARSCLPFYDSTKGRGGAGPSAPNKSLCKLEVPAGFRMGRRISPFPESPPPLPGGGDTLCLPGGGRPLPGLGPEEPRLTPT